MAKKDPSLNWEDTLRGRLQDSRLKDEAANRQWKRGKGAYGNTAKSSRRARERYKPFLSRGMSLAQLEKQAARAYPMGAPHMVEGSMGAHQAEQLAMRKQMQMQMANKLMKGGGGIRLPQLGKGGMKAMLPLLLLALLAGSMGMGGNEDLDGMLG